MKNAIPAGEGVHEASRGFASRIRIRGERLPRADATRPPERRGTDDRGGTVDERGTHDGAATWSGAILSLQLARVYPSLMNEMERIVDQLKRAFESDAWHGPSVREVLEGVDSRQAAERPIAAAHSIWELVLHMAAWSETVRGRLEGERIDEPEAGDWPKLERTDDPAWAEARRWLEQSDRELRQAIAAFPPAGLDQPASPGASYSAYVLIHGAVQHYIYHAGQIALLKKGAKARRER